MSTIVVALGGNALGSTAKEQNEKIAIAAKSMVNLIEQGHNIVVVHGNGPQVGVVKRQMDADSFEMPMPECTAMTQGYIGYHLTQCLMNELAARKINKQVGTVLTQVVVDKNDPAFQAPVKPIGEYFTEEYAARLIAETGKKYVEDSGRGWRLVVPSPKPIDICEKDVIKLLVDNNIVTMAGGGGGMPVLATDGGFVGIDAVIDKDFTAAKIAELISADCLFIITAVDRVKINFGKPDEKSLETITIAEAKQYISEGHFAPGSMLPKVEASLEFVTSGSGRKAIIGALDLAEEAINGKSGTAIVSES